MMVSLTTLHISWLCHMRCTPRAFNGPSLAHALGWHQGCWQCRVTLCSASGVLMVPPHPPRAGVGPPSPCLLKACGPLRCALPEHFFRVMRRGGGAKEHGGETESP